MKQISIESIVSRAWDLAVKHWPIFVLLSFLTAICSSLGTNVACSALSGLGQNPDPQELIEALSQSYNPVLTVIGVLAATYLGFVCTRMLLRALRYGQPYESLSEALKIDLAQYAIFLAAEIAYGIAVGIGLLFCIIPGIYLAVRWIFVPVLIVDKNVGFAEAFRTSWQMTDGNAWKLFLLGLVAICIAIVGLLCCCVGYFFAEVIINFALVLAYNDLLSEPSGFEEVKEETFYVEEPDQPDYEGPQS